MLLCATVDCSAIIVVEVIVVSGTAGYLNNGPADNVRNAILSALTITAVLEIYVVTFIRVEFIV